MAKLGHGIEREEMQMRVFGIKEITGRILMVGTERIQTDRIDS